MKKRKVEILIFISVCIFIFIMSLMGNEEKEIKTPKPVEVEKMAINDKLPYTLQVEEYDIKSETIAYRLWFDLMKILERDGTIESASFTRFTKLSGDANSFVAAVVFQVQLPEGPQEIDYGWGEMNENRVVPNIVWKLTINKAENQTYSLTKIERSTDTQIGLPPIETLEEYQRKAGIDETSGSLKYEIKDETLRITFDNGQTWENVPVAIDALVGVENSSSTQELVDDSFVMTPEKIAFLIEENGKLTVLISTDKGESWNETMVSDQLPYLRIGLLGFTSDEDGYVIVTGDKTMSSEAHFVFKTNDGGQSWYDVGPVADVYSLVTDGGFIDDQLGFISFGEYHLEAQPPIPNLYRTIDGGENWERVEVPIPEEYLSYFTTAEIPTFNGDEGTLLVNQGPMGDYLGGKIMAKFTSGNQGETWSFAGLVDPDGVLLPK